MKGAVRRVPGSWFCFIQLWNDYTYPFTSPLPHFEDIIHVTPFFRSCFLKQSKQITSAAAPPALPIPAQACSVQLPWRSEIDSKDTLLKLVVSPFPSLWTLGLRVYVCAPPIAKTNHQKCGRVRTSFGSHGSVDPVASGQGRHRILASSASGSARSSGGCDQSAAHCPSQGCPAPDFAPGLDS